ncbi:MAG: biotin transporter BioY, partial [Candidatus Dormibacteraceae bacterium]
ALVLGLYPFLIGDVIKAALAAGVLPASRLLVGRKR